jgi:hypothetical protein
VTSVPRWEPDGTESPAERTDPLLPAITDDMLPPLDLPRLPTLDDESLAQMLAELDGDEPALDGGEASLGRESETAPTADPAASDSPASVSAEPAAGPPVERAPGPADRPLRLVEHPGGPVGYRSARGPASRSRIGASASGSKSKYVRREYRPPEVPPDALTLTGLTRRSRSRVGSILFTVVFVGIFLLILVQAIVSLLTPGT